MTAPNPFSARQTITTPLGERAVYRLDALQKAGAAGPAGVESLPYCIKVLLEACLRNVDGHVVTEDDEIGRACVGKEC